MIAFIDVETTIPGTKVGEDGRVAIDAEIKRVSFPYPWMIGKISDVMSVSVRIGDSNVLFANGGERRRFPENVDGTDIVTVFGGAGAVLEEAAKHIEESGCDTVCAWNGESYDFAIFKSLGVPLDRIAETYDAMIAYKVCFGHGSSLSLESAAKRFGVDGKTEPWGIWTLDAFSSDTDFDRFVAYATRDVEVLSKVVEAGNLVEGPLRAVKMIAKAGKECVYSPGITAASIVVEEAKKAGEPDAYECFGRPSGGLIYAEPGIYGRSIAIDISGFYPKLAIYLNISPETVMVDGSGDIVLPNGVTVASHRDGAMKKILGEAVEIKERYAGREDSVSGTAKTVANALCGAFASEEVGMPWITDSITSSGRFVMRHIANTIESKLSATVAAVKTDGMIVICDSDPETVKSVAEAAFGDAIAELGGEKRGDDVRIEGVYDRSIVLNAASYALVGRTEHVQKGKFGKALLDKLDSGVSERIMKAVRSVADESHDGSIEAERLAAVASDLYRNLVGMEPERLYTVKEIRLGVLKAAADYLTRSASGLTLPDKEPSEEARAAAFYEFCHLRSGLKKNGIYSKSLFGSLASTDSAVSRIRVLRGEALFSCDGFDARTRIIVFPDSDEYLGFPRFIGASPDIDASAKELVATLLDLVAPVKVYGLEVDETGTARTLVEHVRKRFGTAPKYITVGAAARSVGRLELAELILGD